MTRGRIDWVAEQSRLLQGIAAEFRETKPFDGLTIGTGIHLEAKTVALLLTLQAGGAALVSTGNLNTTQPDAVARLRERGVTVIGEATKDARLHATYLAQVVAAKPDLILDNGGDLYVEYLKNPYPSLRGGTEETTSGRMRLEPLRNELKMPILVVMSEASYHAPYDHCTVKYLQQAGAKPTFMRLADLGLKGGDLRAAERTFQLLYQVAGRAGRADRPGRALVQTHMPEHPVMQALVSGQRDRFVTAELHDRELAGMPPFGRLASLIISGPDPAAVDNVCAALARRAPHQPGVTVLGPSTAPLALLRGRHRRRFLLKAARDVAVQPLLHGWLEKIGLPGSVRLQVDVDPYSFL